MKKGRTNGLRAAIFIIGVLIIALAIFLPSLAKDAAVMNPEYDYLRLPVLLGLYITAIPFYFSLYQALKLLTYIDREAVFSEQAVLSLKQIKSCALFILILYVIGMLLLVVQNALHPGIAIIGFVIAFAALVISLFTAVLQELLKSAVDLKTENDLTV